MQYFYAAIDMKQTDPKVLLLYRFHLVVLLVNLLALVVDSISGHYSNVVIEFCMVLLLLFSLKYLHKEQKLIRSAHLFTAIVSIGLFTLIYFNQFATMSIVFILLLPLMTLLFFELKESLLITLLLFFVMGILLYLESRHNPSNPLIQNPQAIFNLGYTAVIVYVFGLMYHFSILRTFKELDAANRQKELLLKEVHHRVKNNLNVIASIIGLQTESVSKKEQEQLLKSKVRIESIAMVHEMLYRSEDFGNVDVTAYMHKLSKLLIEMFGRQENVKVVISSEVSTLPLNVMVQLGILLNELLTNSIKHAFEHSKGKITMHIRDDGSSYCFTYEDDGKGVSHPEKLMQGSTLGVKLIHLTAKQLRGEVQISAQNGLKYKIRFAHA